MNHCRNVERNRWENARWWGLVLTVALVLVLTTAWGARSTWAFAQEAPKQPAEFQPPALLHPDSWTLVVIPDPQTYQRCSLNQGIFDMMTAWIAANLERLNIQQVLCVGDLVQANNTEEFVKPNMDQNSTQMWTAAARAFERLDGKISYVLCTGNHDHGFIKSENRDSQLPKYFPITKNPAWNGSLVATKDEGSLVNAAYEFTAPGGQKVLTLSLEYSPTDADLDWARQLISSERYAGHFVILLTHCYMNTHLGGNELLEGNVPDGNSGRKIWEKLGQPSTNIRMVICGHLSHSTDMQGCTGFRVEPNAAGLPVCQLLFDTQSIGKNNGGNGWLQLLEFSKDMKTVNVRTFSPLFERIPSKQASAWNRSSCCEFSFSLEPEGNTTEQTGTDHAETEQTQSPETAALPEAESPVTEEKHP